MNLSLWRLEKNNFLNNIYEPSVKNNFLNNIYEPSVETVTLA